MYLVQKKVHTTLRGVVNTFLSIGLGCILICLLDGLNQQFPKHLSFNKIPLFTNNVGYILMVAIQKMFFGKDYTYKNCNFEPICLLLKSVKMRRVHI